MQQKQTNARRTRLELSMIRQVNASAGMPVQMYNLERLISRELKPIRHKAMSLKAVCDGLGFLRMVYAEFIWLECYAYTSHPS
jgi:hypothetical protein